MAADRRLALVVGASGGVGRALADALVEAAAHDEVIALSRTAPDGWTGRHIPLELTDEARIAAAAKAARHLGAADTVFVASGILHEGEVQPEKSYRAVSSEPLQRLFAVNAIGPALVAKHFLPLAPSQRRSQLAVLSARVGSIGDNRLGGWYGYRASKAALNMLIRTLAVEHRRTHPQAVVVALHPGTVATGLSVPFARGRDMLSPAGSAAALMNTLDGLTADDTGGFFGWDGQPIPW